MFGGPGSGPKPGHKSSWYDRPSRDDGTAPEAITPDAAEAFSTRFDAAFKDSKYKGFVTHYTPDEIQGMRSMILDNDGETGALVKDHGDGRVEATALFNTSEKKGAGIDMLRRTIEEQGVNYCECYGDQLPLMYAELGFQTVEQYPFDRSMAAPDWDYEQFDSPDYHIMTIGGRPTDQLVTSRAMRYTSGMAEPTDEEIDAKLARLKAQAEAEADPAWWAKYGEANWQAALVQAGYASPS
ncbi:MAG TPA: hypothetical protein VMX12_12140 [Acidimicrobiia bacterium]|nr:hypothetical protein [Acidimicrobiia bacterium]